MKGFEIMKKSVKRIAATAAAVMMMLSGSAIGASAVEERNESYYGTYMRVLCTSQIYTGTNKSYSRNLTTYLNATKRYCLAKTQVLNSSLSLIDGQTKSGSLSKGGVLGPNVTVNNSKAATATFYSEVRKTTSSSSSIIENCRLNIKLID